MIHLLVIGWWLMVAWLALCVLVKVAQAFTDPSQPTVSVKAGVLELVHDKGTGCYLGTYQYGNGTKEDFYATREYGNLRVYRVRDSEALPNLIGNVQKELRHRKFIATMEAAQRRELLEAVQRAP